MHLKFDNVNDAFYGMVTGFYSAANSFPRAGAFPHKGTGGEGRHVLCNVDKRNSRNSGTLTIEEPVIITYNNPRQRVLFNLARDANPFFHAYESLWMLAGRNDVAPLKYYVDRMSDFSDDGKTFNGAYGYRWRKAPCGVGETWVDDGDRLVVDQLAVLIKHLRTLPESRRAVLQMWNVENDLLKIGPNVEHPETPCPHCKGTKVKPGTESIYCQYCSGTGRARKAWTEGTTSKDVCCNLSVMFSIRGCPRDYNNDGDCDKHKEGCPKYLDMTVTNRSNDTILGALGANVVHFSFLQEYMANCLGVEVGVYNQISNNLHVYLDNWKPDEWLAQEAQFVGYTGVDVNKVPQLVQNKEQFDKECKQFTDRYAGGQVGDTSPPVYTEPFLETVAKPMCEAFGFHKHRDYEAAFYWVDKVVAEDWQVAGVNWLSKRKRNHQAKEKSIG